MALSEGRGQSQEPVRKVTLQWQGDFQGTLYAFAFSDFLFFCTVVPAPP